MRVLIVTQRVDEDHDILGFFLGWIQELALVTDGVEVLAQEVRPHDLDGSISVRSLGKERGDAKFFQFLRLQRSLIDIVLRRRAVDLILCHMCPEYVPLCYPVARLGRVPLLLWYTHGKANRRLRLAVRLAERTLTASLPAFPLESTKILALGHGIDTRKFRVTPMPPAGPRVVIAVGRISEVKDHQLVVRGFASMLRRTGRRDLELRIVGGPPRPEDQGQVQALERLIVDEGVDEFVSLVGSVPYKEIDAHLARSHVLVSASRTGSLDKSVLEAMASGRPVLISNPSFRTELEGQEELLMFREGDAGHLGEQLERLVALDNEELEALGRRLARRIVGRHDLMGFVRRLVSAFDHASSSEAR